MLKQNPRKNTQNLAWNRTREDKRKIFLDSNLRNSFCSSRHYNYGIYMVQYIFTKKIYYAIKAPNFKIFDLQCNGITTNFWMPFKQQESSARGKHHWTPKFHNFLLVLLLQYCCSLPTIQKIYAVQSNFWSFLRNMVGTKECQKPFPEWL